MINEERFKLAPNESPEYNTNHAGHYVIEAYGSGPAASYYKHVREYWAEDPLDDVDIALISYFTTGTIYHETADKFFGNMQWNKYNDRDTNFKLLVVTLKKKPTEAKRQWNITQP